MRTTCKPYACIACVRCASPENPSSVKCWAAVHLNDQPGFGTVKIGDVMANDLLPYEPHRKIAQKIVPQMFFFPRHVPPQLSGMVDKLRVVLIIHQPISHFSTVGSAIFQSAQAPGNGRRPEDNPPVCGLRRSQPPFTRGPI